MKYKQEFDDSEVWPIMNGYKMACCDCGLIHTMTFSVAEIVKQGKNGEFTAKILRGKKYRVMFTARRDNRATGQKRRHKK